VKGKYVQAKERKQMWLPKRTEVEKVCCESGMHKKGLHKDHLQRQPHIHHPGGSMLPADRD